MSDQRKTDMLVKFQNQRILLKEVIDEMPEGADKAALTHYWNYGSAIDTATEDNIVEVVSDIIRKSQGDALYLEGLAVIARRSK